ncbi:MAG: Glycerol-3-phosphate dehydrogenase [NAD(P)+] [Parcubacteria group bacterium GW2011_GWB1_41_4]|nr:MAG: Glycerol-3-phosphate dehydrogenase [NAD(P)+] [Parcubacteria group bacterium GW2011_GWB1_41_4]
MKILIVGNGEIGSAIGQILGSRDHVVYFWDKNPELSSPWHLFKQSFEEIARVSDFVFFCVPSWCLREALGSFKSLFGERAILVNLAKGMEADGKTMDQVIGEIVSNKFVLMSGPMLAEEISEEKFGSAVLAGIDADVIKKTSQLFLGTNIHIETSQEVRTVAFAGVLKNVYALAIGIVSGLGFGDNLKGFLTSRILEEWNYLADILSLDKAILWGRAGEGDFITTAFSRYSKNHELGERLAKGQLGNLKSEGISSLLGLVKVVTEKNHQLPKYLHSLKRVVIDQEPAKNVFQFDSK